MHQRAMGLFRKAQAKGDPVEYAPIARAFSSLDASTAAKVGRKFEISYLLAKEHIAFAKMDSFCDLEECHGVDLGTGGKHEKACATYADYIAMSLKRQLKSNLENRRFFSVQTDGSNDAANVEEEMYVALSCPVSSRPTVGLLKCVHLRDLASSLFQQQ